MVTSMRVIALAGLLSLVGCVHASPGSALPEAAMHPAPRSQLMGEVDGLIAALDRDDIAAVHASMTTRLQQRLPAATLTEAAAELRDTHGRPRGIMEEHLQREGDLTWYSGLVIHGARASGREVLTPVLYQLAFTSTRKVERILVREHWFIDRVQAPAEDYLPVTRLHVPAEGTWTVAQGGPTAELNAHHGSGSQRFAYDLVLVIDDRFRRPGLDPTRNEAYYGYGQPLRAPAAGTVIEVVDGVPDNVPGERGEAGGNGLVIDHGFGERSSLWHARPDSLRVKVGDHVEPGQVVAEVGNSGRSTGAHIHLHLTRADDELALPAVFVDVGLDGVARDHARPIRGDRIEARLPTPSAALARGPRVFVDARAPGRAGSALVP